MAKKKTAKKSTRKKRTRRSKAEIDQICEQVKQALHMATGNGEKLSVAKACAMYDITQQQFYKCKDRASQKELAVNEQGDNSQSTAIMVRDVYDEMETALNAIYEANEALDTVNHYSHDDVIRFLRTFKNKIIKEVLK